MHELIYRFLLEAGFSRASLISLAEPVSPLQGKLTRSAQSVVRPTVADVDRTEKYRRAFSSRSDNAQVVASSDPSEREVVQSDNADPAYLVVDPETADVLAVMAVVDEAAATALDRYQQEAYRFARLAGDEHTQVYLIQLKSAAESSDERVNFYHAVSPGQRQPVSAYAFPDLDTLRAYRIQSNAVARSQAVVTEQTSAQENQSSGPGRVYFLAVLLLLLAAADWWQQLRHGVDLLSMQQVLLIVTACLLLAAPVLSLRYRRTRKRR